MLARVETKGLPLGPGSVGTAVGPKEASGLGEKKGWRAGGYEEP